MYKHKQYRVKRDVKIIQRLLNVYSNQLLRTSPDKAIEYVKMKNVVKEFVFEASEEIADDLPMASSSAFTLEDAMRVLGFTTKPTKEEVEEVCAGTKFGSPFNRK